MNEQTATRGQTATMTELYVSMSNKLKRLEKEIAAKERALGRHDQQTTQLKQKINKNVREVNDDIRSWRVHVSKGQEVNDDQVKYTHRVLDSLRNGLDDAHYDADVVEAHIDAMEMVSQKALDNFRDLNELKSRICKQKTIVKGLKAQLNTGTREALCKELMWLKGEHNRTSQEFESLGVALVRTAHEQDTASVSSPLRPQRSVSFHERSPDTVLSPNIIKLKICNNCKDSYNSSTSDTNACTGSVSTSSNSADANASATEPEQLHGLRAHVISNQQYGLCMCRFCNQQESLREKQVEKFDSVRKTLFKPVRKSKRARRVPKKYIE